MPEAERVLAFLETLPVVSGLRAGERLKLLDFQRHFVRSVYEPRDDAGNRLVRRAGCPWHAATASRRCCPALSLAHLLGPCLEPYGHC